MELIVTHRGPRPLSIVDLGPDIWQLLFDYVKLPSDLKTLCLVCRELRALTIPHLYRRIHLCLWSSKENTRFFRCMSAGGGLHLSNVRSLIIEEDAIKGKPMFETYPQKSENAVVKNQRIELVVALIPKDKLTSFRFISSRHIDLRYFCKVFRQQTNLTHIYGPIHIDPRELSSEMMTRFSTIRSLDMPFQHHSGGIIGIHEVLRKSCPALERLSFGTLPSTKTMKFSIGKYTHTGAELDLPKLKDVRLKGISLSEIFDPHSYFFNFSQLVRVTLYHCSGLWEAFEKLAPKIDGSKPALEHLAIQGCDDEDEESIENQDVAEKALLTLIKGLSSLHAGGVNLKSTAQFLANNAHQAQNLHSLSINIEDKDAEVPKDHWAYERIKFGAICKACPKIKALGYCIKLEELMDNFELENEPNRDVECFLQSLEDLPDLRILHIQWHSSTDEWFNSFAGEDWESLPEWVNIAHFKMQALVTEIFRFFHTGKTCPKLNAVVIPSFWPSDHDVPQPKPGHGECHFKYRRCYIKAFQTDIRGRTDVSAVAVTERELRYAEPYADILDLDRDQDWYGGSPVRLNDV